MRLRGVVQSTTRQKHVNAHFTSEPQVQASLTLSRRRARCGCATLSPPSSLHPRGRGTNSEGTTPPVDFAPPPLMFVSNVLVFEFCPDVRLLASGPCGSLSFIFSQVLRLLLRREIIQKRMRESFWVNIGDRESIYTQQTKPSQHHVVSHMHSSCCGVTGVV